MKSKLEIKLNLLKEESVPSKKYLFFDTETSGFIIKSLSYDDPEQAWTVQIGAILTTDQKPIEMMNVLIKANGREMNHHAQEIHGISVEEADRKGISELNAANQFGLMLSKADLIVCHNFDFDWQYVYQLMQRQLDQMTDVSRSAFYLDTPSFCTMKTKEIKKYVAARNVKGNIKWPKLVELHQKLFGCEFENAHDAMADITATKDCFFELLNRGIIEI